MTAPVSAQSTQEKVKDATTTTVLRGLYCNDGDGSRICTKLPGLGEKCIGGKCAADFGCVWVSDKGYICLNKVGKEGELCDERDGVTCEEGLVCDDYECVKGECVNNDDCKYIKDWSKHSYLLMLFFIF